MGIGDSMRINEEEGGMLLQRHSNTCCVLVILLPQLEDGVQVEMPSN